MKVVNKHYFFVGSNREIDWMRFDVPNDRKAFALKYLQLMRAIYLAALV